MKQRNNEIQYAVKEALRSGNQLSSLRKLCDGCNEEELHIVMAEIGENSPLSPTVRAAIERVRHKQIREQLDDLKKPTWLDTWTFRFVVIGTIITFLDFYRPFLLSDSNNFPTPSSTVSTYLTWTQFEPQSAQGKSLKTLKAVSTNSFALPASPEK